MNSIDCIFWDNDGVLVDTEHLYYQATCETLADVGIEVSRETFIDISLRQGKSVLDLAGTQTAQALRGARNRRYSELLHQGVSPIEGVEATLRQLHGKVQMGIVTSSHRDHFEIIHRNTGLLQYFDFVMTRENYEHSKPNPEPYLKALARSRCEAGQCLVVEDSERGLKAAVSAGLRCLVIPGTLNRGSDLSSAHRVLSSVREIPPLLLSP